MSSYTGVLDAGASLKIGENTQLFDGSCGF
jgi:hypothetical protein